MLVQSATGAAAQYGCYAYDGALTLEFTKSTSNGTTISTVPREAELALNVLRFTSLTHIYYMMFLIFDMQCIIFFTVVHSQNRFNGRYCKYVWLPILKRMAIENLNIEYFNSTASMLLMCLRNSLLI